MSILPRGIALYSARLLSRPFSAFASSSSSRMASPTPPSDFKLPHDFLTGPAPSLQRTEFDFAKTRLDKYENHYAVVLDGCLSKEECETLVTAAESHTNGEWERAMVNVGGGRQRMITDVRNCGRIIWDSPEMVAKIWARIEGVVPELHMLKNWGRVTGQAKVPWKMTRLNERMRFLKYGAGEYFRPHGDGSFVTPDGKERSFFTLHLYLNDETSDPAEPLHGGATTFHSPNMLHDLDVEPKIGRILLFQHRNLIHSGAEVESGIKLTMRTDIMFTKASGEEADSQAQ